MNQYMGAMQNLMANPSVVNMVEKIGQQMMQDPQMSAMMQARTEWIRTSVNIWQTPPPCRFARLACPSPLPHR